MLKSKIFYLLAIVLLLFIPTALLAQGESDPSSLPLSSNSITPVITEQGRISVSVDGLGTASANGVLQIEKPTGATVRGAYFMAAGTGNTRIQIPDGSISINGVGINWGNSVQSSLSSWNHWANVTTLMAPILDAAPPGLVDFTISETNSSRVDGTILAVIFDDPNQPANATNSVILLFGAQNVNGDTFAVNLGTPLDTTDPNLTLDLGLGISFGAQGCRNGQYNQVDVNGIRLTTSAGGEDDGSCANGALLTVGGVGDSNANPPDPFATDNGDPRTDDELYSLIPFVSNGDTSITITTRNPSNDDNILFSYFSLSTLATVIVDPTPTPSPTSPPPPPTPTPTNPDNPSGTPAPPAVPEPMTIILLGSGVTALGAYARKRRKDANG